METDTSDQSLLIERKQIVDLPLNGREYTDLALLSPGVQVGKLQDGSVNQRRGSFVVNGMRSTANNFLLDGLDNNDYQIANQGFNNEAVDESVDAVQEFRVDTSNFPPNTAALAERSSTSAHGVAQKTSTAAPGSTFATRSSTPMAPSTERDRSRR